MISADFVVGRCDRLLTRRGPLPKRKSALLNLGIVEGGCIASWDGKIEFIGSEEELGALSLERPDSMLLLGTTTAEAKSGYGLNLVDEIKQLEALKKADACHPIAVVPEFMGAHKVQREYKSRKEDDIHLLTHEILPKVKSGRLAEFLDFFAKKASTRSKKHRD